jgi:guanylate kinase
MVVVLSGPSGVGKDTLLAWLVQRCPGIEQCVTCTTREPRPNEIPGKDYNFVSEQEFRRMIEQGELLEYAKVYLDFYGSPRSSVNRILETGSDAILKIDVQGGLAVKEKLPEAIMIFVAPPSMEELEHRLRSRYTDSEQAIQKRLADARGEMARIPDYDYLVVNDNLEDTVDRLRCIILAERSRIR